MPVIGIDFPIAVLFVFEAPPRSDLKNKKNKKTLTNKVLFYASVVGSQSGFINNNNNNKKAVSLLLRFDCR